MPPRGAPRLALWLLERRLPAHEREFVIGDLLETWRASRGDLHARWRFWRECLALCVRTDPDPAFTPFERSPVTDLGLDLTLAVRRLRRAPGFTLAAALTIALGTGAAVAIVSVTRPMLWGPLPFARAERIVTIRERFLEGDSFSLGNLGYATITDLARRTQSFEAVAAASYWSPTLTEDGRATRLTGSSVSASWFDLHGIRPVLGRTFRQDEDAPAGARVAILTHALWQGRYGGDSAIVGRRVMLDGVAHEVVGVLPRSYESLLVPNAAIVQPLRYADTLGWACRDCRHLQAIARLRDGVSLAAAAQDASGAFARMASEYPAVYGPNGVALTTLRRQVGERVRGPMLALIGAAALLLAVALANTINLFVARAIGRRHEGVVRAALGARRWRILRSFMVEAMLVAALGALFGAALARSSLGLLLSLAPASLPRLEQAVVGGPALALAGLLALVVGGLAGLATMNILGGDGTHAVPMATRSVVRGNHDLLRKGLVVAAVAMAMVLVTGSALLVQSVQRLLRVDPGFTPEGRVSMALSVSGPQYTEDARVWQAWRDVLRALEGLPGVARVALTSQLPLANGFDAYGLRWEGGEGRAAEASGGFRYAVSASYAATMDLRLLEGRFLEPSDVGTGAPVAVVSRAVARRHGGAPAVGARIQMGGSDTPWRTVVGVVEDVRHPSLDTEPGGGIYLPLEQNHFADASVRVVMESSLPARALASSVEAAVARIDPTITVDEVTSVPALVERAASQRRFAERLFQAFGMVAVLLAAIGLTGMVSALVGERVREIGVRAALGATQERILVLFVRQGGRLAAVGIGVGVMLSWGMAKVLRPLVYGVSARDPLTFGLAALSLGVVSLLATFWPAWRASRVDAAEALRADA